jgi:hypothetical protein
VESASPDSHGVYIPAAGESLTPQGKVRYRIEARKPAENLYLWAETLVPDTFSMTLTPYPLVNDTIPTPLDWSHPPMSLNWTLPDSCNGFIISSLCLTPYDSLLPLDPQYDLDKEENPQVIGVLSLGSNSIEIPWILFSWVGWHKIELQASGSDYLEYCQSILYTQNVDPAFNIHGGIGMFAGLSRHRFYLYLKRT